MKGAAPGARGERGSRRTAENKRRKTRDQFVPQADLREGDSWFDIVPFFGAGFIRDSSAG